MNADAQLLGLKLDCEIVWSLFDEAGRKLHFRLNDSEYAVVAAMSDRQRWAFLTLRQWNHFRRDRLLTQGGTHHGPTPTSQTP